MSNIERSFAGCSRDVYHRNGEEEVEPFCTHENWQSAVVFLNQELELNALPSICNNDHGRGQLDVVSLVNVNWSLILGHKEKMKKISDLENQMRRYASDIEHMNTNIQKLRDLIEYKERQANDSESRERQALIMNQQLQNELKMAKDEVKKFSSMLLHRETRYNHEAKRKEQEIAKLKERLLKVLTEAKSGHHRNHVSIEVIGDMIDKPGGKPRGRWKNEDEDLKRGDDLLQRVILGNQNQQDTLANECELLQNQMTQMLRDLSSHVGQDLNPDIAKLPSTCEAFQIEWTSLLDKIAPPKETTAKTYERADTITGDILENNFSLGTFVPLSDVKHTAPPGWVSRAQCTLPPTGKAETVKLRAVSATSDKPRPRSTHLSPYRGMQANRTHTPNVGRSQTGSRCGSLSPTSVSPTRNSTTCDTRSLPRMIGSKLSLRRPTSLQNSSANNSSADESSGPVATYRKIVSKRRPIIPATTRPQSPPVRGASYATGDSESESSNEFAKQLKNLGKYLEKRELRRKESEDNIEDVLDTEMDEYLVNIRKALSKKSK